MSDEKPIKRPCEDPNSQPAYCMDCINLHSCADPKCERARDWKLYRQGWRKS
jgi:hypothetical protein